VNLPKPLRAQSGATLVIVLIMLVILTLFGISAVNLSNSNLRVVGNLQARKQTEAIALQTAEQVMGSMSYFNVPTPAATATVDNYKREISQRVCQYATAASGYSAIQPIVPEDTLWDFHVTVTDTVSNARARVWQGAKIRMLAGNCSANLLYCPNTQLCTRPPD
jgi:type II secretory pathway pseudopilin PulG